MNNYHISVWLVSGITLRYRKGNWDGDLFHLLEEVGRWLTVEPRTGLCAPGSAHPPGVQGKIAGFGYTGKHLGKSPVWEFNDHCWGAISEAQCCTWGVFSCSLLSTQGLDFSVLPSSWKLLELKTCSLECSLVSHLEMSSGKAECSV